jgi:hypothetical protein
MWGLESFFEEIAVLQYKQSIARAGLGQLGMQNLV